jgi:hypothetical protein
MSKPKKYLSITQALNVVPVPITRPALHGWIHDGVNGKKLKVLRIGRRYFVEESVLFEFIAEMQAVEEATA